MSFVVVVSGLCGTSGLCFFFCFFFLPLYICRSVELLCPRCPVLMWVSYVSPAGAQSDPHGVLSGTHHALGSGVELLRRRVRTGKLCALAWRSEVFRRNFSFRITVLDRPHHHSRTFRLCDRQGDDSRNICGSPFCLTLKHQKTTTTTQMYH